MSNSERTRSPRRRSDALCRSPALILILGFLPLLFAAVAPVAACPVTGPAAPWIERYQHLAANQPEHCAPVVIPAVPASSPSRAFALTHLAGAGQAEPGIVYTRDNIVERLIVLAEDATGCVHAAAAGRGLPFAERAVLSPLANVRIPAALGATPPVAVVADTKAIRPWIEHWAESEFRTAAARHWLLLGGYAAVLAVLLLVGIGFLLWQPSGFALAYVVYLATLQVYQLQALGLGPAWLPFWPGPEHARLTQALAIALVVPGIGAAVLAFLRPEQGLRRVIITGIAITSVAFLAAAWTTWGYRVGALGLAMLAILVLLLLAQRLLDAAPDSAPTGSRAALRWFAAGIGASMIGGGLQAVSILGVGAGTPDVLAVAFAIGNLVESLCWLIALALHFRAGHLADRQRLWAAAYRDSLTGLHNRRWLREQIEQAMRAAERQPMAPSQLLLLDLDNFRTVNAGCGQQGGDEVLASVGKTLTGLLEHGEAIGRFSGDELVLLLRPGQDACVAEGRAASILAKLAQPLRWGDCLLRLRASIGIVGIHSGYPRVDDIIADAALAKEAARRAGGHRAVRFVPAMRRASSAAEQLRGELKTALASPPEQDGFLLHFQPVVALDDGRPLGVEALLRWQHPRRGLLKAAQFVQVASAAGVSRELGHRVLRLACAALRRWQQKRWYCGEYLSVNLATEQVGDEALLSEIKQAVEREGIEPYMLRLELPAASLTATSTAVDAWRERLAGQQILLLLDGFGATHTPLAALADLAFDSFKLDPVLAAGVASQGRAQSLVQAGVALGEQFGCLVIAKGIESQAQADQFHRLGCQYGQGNHLAPAMSADDLEAWMQLWRDQCPRDDVPMSETRIH
jgi:diguanylate cyclase (GGDEF)-like protein